MQGFSHFDDSGNAVMVDVTEKKSTTRMAVAEGTIFCNKAIIDAILQKNIKKGDVLGVARIAGIMAVKQTAHLIPMCHPLLISKSSIDFEINEEKNCIKALCTVKIEGKTGVEMEALTGVNIALLTIYDMCKAVDKRMLISDIHLVEKHGGKSADFYFDGAK
ncbi:cyclic pyranopterin monophosphate synthase MoaC [Taurinivorans muris]|jgi:molybdenum cofactor biosynthesis protein MoaC|uniref:Cyclic pyranopterin monophosphate synthase n=1 Tax=Taurinivorans muris TaxID=2787751 RepID=A0ABY5Y1N0_9BACT|nr:cyclic pyranopterin monophosphate synthase MoaC [Mailhella sp.]UWX05965.1 cyclic pyranopterin monophosphate synthase MoaC [Desulfovibrionaceae bacterium LT0009]